MVGAIDGMVMESKMPPQSKEVLENIVTCRHLDHIRNIYIVVPIEQKVLLHSARLQKHQNQGGKNPSRIFYPQGFTPGYTATEMFAKPSFVITE